MNASRPSPDVSRPTTDPGHERWHFIRDLLVFQLKLVLGNLLNFVMLPVSLAAAVYDLLVKPKERQGENFYRVLEWSREADEAINVYGAIGGYHSTGRSPAAVCAEDAQPAADVAGGTDPGGPSGAGWRGTTVDGVVRSVEDAIVREIRKGGSAASLKAAIDRLLDQMQRDAGSKGSGKENPNKSDT